MSTTFPTRRHHCSPKPAPKPQPVVVSDATLRRLIATGGRIEAPTGPTKVA
jgi:hypothetical protein